MSKRNKIIFLIILLAGIFLRIYKLYDVPKGIEIDEAGMFVDANMIAKFGVDRYYNKMPIYLPNFGGGQSIMYAYLTAFLIKIFSSSYSLIRAVSVISGITVMIFSYLISKEFLNEKKTLFVFSMVSLCPYFIQASRIGMDCNLLLGMTLIALYAYIKAIKRKSIILYGLSGLLFGLCFYTYAVGYMVISIFIFLSMLYLIKNKKINIKSIIIFCITFLITITPIILFLMVNYGIIKEFKLLFFTINKIPEFRAGEINPGYIIYNIPKFMDLLSSDLIQYNSTLLFGSIYYIFIPVFFIGLFLYSKKVYSDIKNKKFDLENIIYILFISNFITLMSIESPNINKGNAIYFSVIYFIVYGIFYIKKEKIINTAYIILIICSINFSVYYLNYFDYYDEAFFDDELYEIINENYDELKDKEITINIFNMQEYIYEDLGKITKIENKNQIINKKNKDLNLKSICFVDKRNYEKYKKYFKKEIAYNRYYMFYN